MIVFFIFMSLAIEYALGIVASHSCTLSHYSAKCTLSKIA